MAPVRRQAYDRRAAQMDEPVRTLSINPQGSDVVCHLIESLD